MKTFSPQKNGVGEAALAALLDIRHNETVLKLSLEQSLLSAGWRFSSGQILPAFIKNTPTKAEKRTKKGRSDSKSTRHKANQKRHKLKHPKKPLARRDIAGSLITLAVLCMAMTVFYSVLTHPPEPPPSPAVPTLHTIPYSKPLPSHKRRYHQKPHPGRRSPRRVRRPEQRSPCGCSG